MWPWLVTFAGDEHQAVIPAQLLDVVRLGEPMDLSAQLSAPSSTPSKKKRSLIEMFSALASLSFFPRVGS